MQNTGHYPNIYIFVSPIIYSFNKYLRSTYCLPGTVLSAFETSVNKKKEKRKKKKDACPSRGGDSC